MPDKGRLYIVATPIGNLDDITIRAIKVLGSVDLIACEDTRKSSILLRHLDIKVPIISLHKFSEAQRTATILNKLEQGKDVALVSDAGTPAVSDPGSLLVHAVRESGYQVVPIPGPSSITTALSVAGVDCSTFVYLGFAPKKDVQLKRFFNEIREQQNTCVFFESPARVVKTLRVATEILGSRPMLLMRELTKLYEEIFPGSPESILANLEQRPSIKGEIVIVVEPGSPVQDDIDLTDVVTSLMDEGFSGKRLAEEAHKRYRVKKSLAYDIFLEIKDK
jgi:16S rRNA (cytidine1402-2'-O)-methyltransferase